ncbi:ion channel [Parafrankia sp. BMG5.11]|uniref:ion channel n=1 Tax=Parafrankia sp. BMG5.11 TaxID=222540 RepID=UPI00103EF71C|nr:ion channel [Parafrankia sp. BMG5.11]TCJ38883.1 two pore domain potassium channel family protein [Parafrankia sp. BMG5.11]
MSLINSHRLMIMAGPLVLTITVATWLFLLWAGWFLVFWSYPPSLLSSSTEAVADFSDRIYFVGYTIFTLGNGDFSPSAGSWQVATALASGTGLFTATLAITYLISVISAAVSARAFAAEVRGLGNTPAEAVAAGWDGNSYSGLSLPLNSIASQLTKLSQQYLAYPVFQYFHSDEAGKSPIVGLARLDQVLMIAAHGVPDRFRPPEVILNSARSAIVNVLEALPKHFTKPGDAPLPIPSLDALRSRGQPVVPEDEFAIEVGSEQDRRKRLHGLLIAHGWGVEDI